MRLLLIPLLAAGLAFAQPNPMTPNPSAPRPIDGIDTVWLEEMTWMEVRDAVKAGKRSILIPTGGVEQNGPYLAAGKHNYILRATAEAIARKLGNCLVAPIVPFVPEGNIDPPGSHMLYPSTISLREDTYRALLTDIAESLHQHGFTEILLIGDSGGNTKGMADVATKLGKAWAATSSRIHHIPEYYDYADVKKFLESQGIHESNEGIHDDYAITSQMMVIDPTTVRMQQRIAKGKFTINGVPLAPAAKTIAMGKRVVDYRAGKTVAAILKRRAEHRSPK